MIKKVIADTTVGLCAFTLISAFIYGMYRLGSHNPEVITVTLGGVILLMLAILMLNLARLIGSSIIETVSQNIHDWKCDMRDKRNLEESRRKKNWD